jgi:alcohol dehydrogenase
MRVNVAVLNEMGRPQPYTTSAPLDVVEAELAPPGPGELLVRIAAAGVCHSDLSVVNGSRPRPTPMALGHEAAGHVVEVGAGITDVAEGDHVVCVFVPRCGTCAACGAGQPALCERAAASNAAGELLRGGRRLRRADGEELNHHLGVSAFADHAVVDRGSVVVVPDDVPSEIAALFGCALLTGVGAVQTTAGVRPGDSVAVLGMGGVGLAALLGAALAGAHPIVAVDPIEEKRALARELGATQAVAPDGAVDAVRAAVPGGVAHAFEAVGSAAVLAEAFRMTARGGTTVAIGLPDPSEELRLPATALVGEARTVVGSYMGSAVPERDVPKLIRLWQAGLLPVERLHTATLGLGEVNEALDALAQGRSVRQIIRPDR